MSRAPLPKPAASRRPTAVAARLPLLPALALAFAALDGAVVFLAGQLLKTFGAAH